MAKLKFIDAVLDRAEIQEVAMVALSLHEKRLVTELMDEAAQHSLQAIPEGEDDSKFTISRNQKKGVIETLKKREFKDKPEKIKPASAFVDELAKELQWVGRNRKLLQRLNNTIAEFKSFSESEE